MNHNAKLSAKLLSTSSKAASKRRTSQKLQNGFKQRTRSKAKKSLLLRKNRPNIDTSRLKTKTSITNYPGFPSLIIPLIQPLNPQVHIINVITKDQILQLSEISQHPDYTDKIFPSDSSLLNLIEHYTNQLEELLSIQFHVDDKITLFKAYESHYSWEHFHFFFVKPFFKLKRNNPKLFLIFNHYISLVGKMCIPLFYEHNEEYEYDSYLEHLDSLTQYPEDHKNDYSDLEEEITFSNSVIDHWDKKVIPYSNSIQSLDANLETLIQTINNYKPRKKQNIQLKQWMVNGITFLQNKFSLKDYYLSHSISETFYPDSYLKPSGYISFLWDVDDPITYGAITSSECYGLESGKEPLSIQTLFDQPLDVISASFKTQEKQIEAFLSWWDNGCLLSQKF